MDNVRNEYDKSPESFIKYLIEILPNNLKHVQVISQIFYFIQQQPPPPQVYADKEFNKNY